LRRLFRVFAGHLQRILNQDANQSRCCCIERLGDICEEIPPPYPSLSVARRGDDVKKERQS